MARESEGLSAPCWRDRLPRGVLDPFCPAGHVIGETTDRRLLWHMELVMGNAPAGYSNESRLALRAYLNETCEHHWHSYAAERDIPAHKQCLWCNDVDWLGGA